MHNSRRLALHDEFNHLLQENALKLLEPPRLQGAALNNYIAVAGKERVILRFVAEHCVELFVELHFDAWGKFLRQTSSQFVDICRRGGHVAAIISGISARRVARRGGYKRGWNKIDAIGIDLDDLRAALV